MSSTKIYVVRVDFVPGDVSIKGSPITVRVEKDLRKDREEWTEN